MTTEAPLLLEIDGPGIHPDTVGSRAAAEVLSRFIRLVEKAAEGRAVDVSLKGLEVFDKCLQVRMKTQDPAGCAAVMADVDVVLRGTIIGKAPGLVTSAREFRTGAKALEGARFRVTVGDWDQDLVFGDEQIHLLPESRTTLRAKILRMGVDPLKARFRSGSESAPFTLDLSEDQVREYRHLLGKEADVTALVRRDEFGKIEGGRLESLVPLDDDDDEPAGESWIRWLTENGQHWDESEDYLDDLGRGDD